MTTRIRESLSTVSEFECGAHAHLSVGPIDYFLYLSDTGICYLGDISVSPHASVEENNFSKYTIRIDRGRYVPSQNNHLFFSCFHEANYKVRKSHGISHFLLRKEADWSKDQIHKS